MWATCVFVDKVMRSYSSVCKYIVVFCVYVCICVGPSLIQGVQNASAMADFLISVRIIKHSTLSSSTGASIYIFSSRNTWIIGVERTMTGVKSTRLNVVTG